MTLGAVAVVGAVAMLLTGGQGSSDRIIGSGSTFAQPLIERAAVDFQNARSGDHDWISGSAGVDYEPIGSMGGVMRLRDPEVDFAVADYPLSSDALQSFGAVQFPIVIGSISPVYRLNGFQGRLQLSPATLAGMFSGKIKSWADPAIKADNPGVALPATAITIVYRQDGSGSTLNWSGYLARSNPAWNSGFGTGTTIKWPVGVGVRGSDAMAKTVASQDGAIGYLETGQARRGKLATVALKGPAGSFVDPDEANVTAGARQMGLLGAAPATPAPNAYPVVTASYLVMKRQNRSPQDNDRTLRFVNFLLDSGAVDARALGYLPLSPESIADVRRVWSHELKFNHADQPDTAS